VYFSFLTYHSPSCQLHSLLVYLISQALSYSNISDHFTTRTDLIRVADPGQQTLYQSWCWHFSPCDLWPFQQQTVEQKAVGGWHVYAGDQVIDMVRSVWILGKIQITIISQPSLHTVGPSHSGSHRRQWHLQSMGRNFDPLQNRNHWNN